MGTLLKALFYKKIKVHFTLKLIKRNSFLKCIKSRSRLTQLKEVEIDQEKKKLLIELPKRKRGRLRKDSLTIVHAINDRDDRFDKDYKPKKPPEGHKYACFNTTAVLKQHYALPPHIYTNFHNKLTQKTLAKLEASAYMKAFFTTKAVPYILEAFTSDKIGLSDTYKKAAEGVIIHDVLKIKTTGGIPWDY